MTRPFSCCIILQQSLVVLGVPKWTDAVAQSAKPVPAVRHSLADVVSLLDRSAQFAWILTAIPDRNDSVVVCVDGFREVEPVLDSPLTFDLQLAQPRRVLYLPGRKR